MKDKQMLVFNFIFDSLWTGSSVGSVAFVGFRELKYVEKHDIKGKPTSVYW